MTPPLQTCCPQYTIRLPVSQFYLTKSQKNTLKKLSKYLSSPTSAPSSSATGESSSPQDLQLLPPHSFTVETVPAEFTAERYELYRKYQIAVHNDPPEKITEQSFTNFLIDSPLFPSARHMAPEDRSLPSLPTPSQFFHPLSSSTEGTEGTPTDAPTGTPTTQYSGTYHQLYRLNGTLVAVSVLDLLPSGVSSVYCFYDPDHRTLELGKYTALYEIAFAHHLRLPFYFLGFYIHNCQKMAYKAEYHPTQALCPVTFQWFDLSPEVKDAMTRHRFTPLAPELRERFAQEMAAEAAQEGDEVARQRVVERYLPSVEDPQAINPRRCQFSLGPYHPGNTRLLRCTDLTAEGKKIVEKILGEFLLLSDQRLGERVVFLFN
jgi:arginyl-tRNA---protein transferase